MSRHTLLTSSLFAATLAGAALVPSLAPAPADAGRSAAREARAPLAVPPPRRYEVRITNLTRGQIFSPPVVAVHSKRLAPLWTVGSPASPELAGVAEDALNQPLIDALIASGEVGDVRVITGAGGPILPGETAVGVVDAGRRHSERLSMAGMLVITNDAFFGLNGVELPKKKKDAGVFLSPAYDAGSEANTELCAHIPGPPCGNGGVRVTTGAEGYVHVHAGVHGIGDLSAAGYDWRNPVARIEIVAMDH